ncbi:MAG: aminopeptidase [Steroidobacteraceae bacterium]
MLTDRRPVPIRILLASLVLAALSGCGTLYLLQAAHGEAHVLDRRQPIARLVASPKTPVRLRATLRQIEAARDFATQALGLPDNRSYRTYSNIGRPYVVWNVVAAPELSVTPIHWCFPIAGCVAYRGYFSEKKARRFAARLKARGDDVLIGGVPAYSTLGHFADPVLSTMLGYGDIDVAEIIFHELTHQLLYVRGDSSFNEAFATTVASEGVRRWLLYQGRIADLARYERQRALDLQYVRLFRRARTRLSRIYASGLPVPEMRARKRAAFARLAADMTALAERSKESDPYADWVAAGLNNADLASVGTYYDCVPGFQRLLKDDLGDLQRFYGDVRALAREPRAERDAQVCRGGTGGARS